MAELIGSFFAGIFGTHSILATIIIAMVPIIELKGAIPIGMSVDYWGNYALNNDIDFARQRILRSGSLILQKTGVMR